MKLYYIYILYFLLHRKTFSVLASATINSVSNWGSDSAKANVRSGIHVININYQSGIDRNALAKKIQKITEEIETKCLYNLKDKNKRHKVRAKERERERER